MDPARSSRIANALKSVEALGKSLKIPTKVTDIISSGNKATNIATKAGVEQVESSGFVRIIMYFMVGILLIFILLLGIDQWVTPIFQRSPGGDGYIPIPGTDMSQVVWTDLKEVSNIYIGIAPTPPVSIGTPAPKSPPQITVIEGQPTYSLTMDVFIENEYSNLPDQRIFFVMGTDVNSPTLRVGLDNTKNTVYISVFNSAGLQETAVIDNVPIRMPFRIGTVVTPFSLDGYLNGRLVMSRKLKNNPIPPSTGSVIFATSNIVKSNPQTVISAGIKVLKIRAFGYSVPPTEMYGRMSDLTAKDTFNPVIPSSPGSCPN
jgi:hypothetical protein